MEIDPLLLFMLLRHNACLQATLSILESSLASDYRYNSKLIKDLQQQFHDRWKD